MRSNSSTPQLRWTVSAVLTLTAWGQLVQGGVDQTPPAQESPGRTVHPVVARFTFDEGGLDAWEFTDQDAWRITPLPDGGHALEQYRASRYEPPVRSPFNIALLPDLDLADFEITLRVRSTARDYGHRDLCVVFGHQDPAHFYYVHLGKEADPHAHSIFLVNGEPRVSIARERTEGTPWTDGWHDVRIVRSVEDGLIEVYFDDMTRPIMTTEDSTIRHGRLGVGSFDDTGLFDDIVVRGRRAD